MKKTENVDIAIIGGGMAGLAAAIRLKKKGNHVLLIDKNDTLGGKVAAFEWNDYRWDKGPSLFTEPNLVDELFLLWDKNPRDYYTYKKLEETCNYYFTDGQKVTLSSNAVQNEANVTEAFGAQSYLELKNYLERSAQLFDAVGDYFISNPKPTARKLWSKELISRYKHLIKKEVRNSLDALNRTHFSNPHLVQLFNRFGTYNGSNPYQMSGLYSSISHVEMNKGAFFPMGGMRAIPEALIRLATEIGVEIRCNTEVEVTPLADGSFQLSGDVSVHAKKLVCAIDHINFYEKILKNPRTAAKWKSVERSTSALVFYWAVDTIIPEFKVHNIFFSDDYPKEFNTIFQDKQLPETPTFYVHISSVMEADDAPKNGQNWFVMVNAPAGTIPKLSYRQDVKRQLLERIQEQFDLDLKKHIVFEDFWDCHAIQNHSGSYQGALYGPSANSLLSAVKKHGNQSKTMKNLFFCGGTVHPGGGIPLVLRSAKIVSNLVV